MARFVNDLYVYLVDEQTNTWKLAENFVYVTDILYLNLIVVPKGTETDFASVPRLPFIYDMLGNIGLRAAVIHDYMYEAPGYTKQEADNVFLEALIASKISRYKAWAMYLAVSMFGNRAYNRVQQRSYNG